MATENAVERISLVFLGLLIAQTHTLHVAFGSENMLHMKA